MTFVTKISIYTLDVNYDYFIIIHVRFLKNTQISVQVDQLRS